jgi:N-formylglutamate deformylase
MSEGIFTLRRGTTPLLVSVPHVGTMIPEDIRRRYEARALAVEDTDWHLDQLYAFVREMGASLIVPRYSRYLIDLNRSPENAPMYAAANNTELCPTRAFTGDALYRNGYAPDDGEIKRRLDAYWQPYHHALTDELARLKATYGHAILFDGHSIKSELPWLFEGRLPDLNLGTVNGTSCAPALRAALTHVIESQTTFTHAIDERFKGGYITRNYGRPSDAWHAVQLEMTWRCYMHEAPPYAVDAARANKLQPVLRALVQTMLDWTPSLDNP